jgi:cytoskeleton protein RodZ
MTDEIDKPEDPTPEAKAEGPLGGERLAEARRSKQISVLEIAKELHVEEAKIRALENNEFERLGAPVFAKGHLKKYSQLVGVNHDDVLADYYRLTRSQEMPPVVVQRQKPPRQLSPGPWIVAVAILLVLALAYWLLVERPIAPLPAPAVTAPPATQTAPPAAAEQADDNDTAAVEPPVDEAGAEAAAERPVPQGSAGEPVQPPAATRQPAAAEAEPSAPPASGADDVRLSMTFVGDCWTEITDASGRRLFFQLGRSGRTVNVSGPGPLSVLFGDADNVEVRVNGEDFTIPATNRRGRTARLTITGA